ncbi:MAG: cytochrome P450 [Polyangiales bacterium]
MSDETPGPIAQGTAWLFARAHADAMDGVRGIPGPTPHFPLGNLGNFMGERPWEVLARYVRAHPGDLVCWWWGGEPVVTPASPRAAHAVLVAQELDFYKDSPRRALTPLLTDVEAFLANPPGWEAVSGRSLFALPGMRGWLDAQVPRIAARARARIDALVGAPAENALNLLRRMGFDAFTELAVGETFDDGAWDDMLAMAHAGHARMGAMREVSEDIDDDAFHRARGALWGRFAACVARARAEGVAGRTDLLAHALAQGTPLGDEALPAALANLYFSGLFSSSSALLSTLWALTQHPDVAGDVRDAVRALPTPWSTSSLAACAPLDRVIREATRLLPPVPVYLRNSAPDRAVDLCGHALPPNTRVFLSNYALHRDPRVWADPDAFVPDRWTDAVCAEVPYGHETFWPFGLGRRACAGQSIALAYVRAVAATALLGPTVRVGAGQPLQGEAFFACASAEGLEVVVSR